LCDDAYENIEIALQLIDNFVGEGGAERQAVFQNLLIDLNNRNAELFQFKEQFKEAVVYFERVVGLVPVQEYDLENMRILSSALYNIGYCNQQLKLNDEASKAFGKAVDIIRTCVVVELQRNGSTSVSHETPNEELVKPSIFDSETVKDLKSLMVELLGQVQDSTEQKHIEAELEKLKKAEGEDVKVDPNFGKVQANADQFKDVSTMVIVRKKRTHDEITKTTETVEPPSSKRKHLTEEETNKCDANSDKENKVNT